MAQISGPDICIRQLTRSEVHLILPVRNATFPHTLDCLNSEDRRPDAIHVAAMVSGEVVSSVRLTPNRANLSEYELGMMATREDCRRRDIGSRVLSAAEATVRQARGTSLVAVSTEMAVPFYVYNGFHIVQNRTMRKSLVPPTTPLHG